MGVLGFGDARLRQGTGRDKAVRQPWGALVSAGLCTWEGEPAAPGPGGWEVVCEGSSDPGKWPPGQVKEEASPWAALSPPCSAHTTRFTACSLPGPHSTLHLPLLNVVLSCFMGQYILIKGFSPCKPTA